MKMSPIQIISVLCFLGALVVHLASSTAEFLTTWQSPCATVHKEPAERR